MSAASPYAYGARQRKVLQLLEAIETFRASLQAELPVRDSDAVMLCWARHLTDEQWASIAVLAAVRPPSVTTRELVLEVLRGRVETAGYVEHHFSELADGAVVDVRHVLGETKEPCASERGAAVRLSALYTVDPDGSRRYLLDEVNRLCDLAQLEEVEP